MQTQEQFNRRVAEISSIVEPLHAKFADFLAQYTKEEMVDITLGLTPVESGCFRLSAIVPYQSGRRMTLARKEAPELSTEQAAPAGLLAAITWEHSREKMPDPIQSAPKTVVYPKEIEGIMDTFKIGQHTLSLDIEQVCAEVFGLCSG
jgi:hypothetical protein